MRHRLAALAALAVAGLVGCGGHAPPRPQGKLKTQPPSCRPGSMGAALRCAPGFQLGAPVAVPGGELGIDLSNNDPSFGAWSTIRHRAVFAYFKVSEGEGFIDNTAARMAREAKHAGLLVGGYDFQHVCGANPVREAEVFVEAAAHAGLLGGRGVLPPTADFEKAFGGCNAKAWLGAWSRTVRRLAGRDQVYSDPGFYRPSVGCFSEATYGWVADLGAFEALCGLRTVFHQYSFSSWDGVASVDGDVFLGSLAQLRRLAGVTESRRDLLARERTLRRVLAADGCNRRAPAHEHLGPRCRRWRHELPAVERELRARRR